MFKGHSDRFVRRSPFAPARILPDRRRHRRVALTLLGRFMREDRSEFPCKLQVISIGSASIASRQEVIIGETIVAHFDNLIPVTGTIARIYEGGFAIEIKGSRQTRERLAAQLTWLINRDDLPEISDRRYDRIPAAEQPVTVLDSDGTLVPATIIDISISGASLGTSKRPTIGTKIRVGKYDAVVRRHHSTGIGVEFIGVGPAGLPDVGGPQ